MTMHFNESGEPEQASNGKPPLRFLTAKQVAPMLGLSVARVYDCARRGLIPCTFVERQVRFMESAIREWAKNGGTRLED